MTAFLESWGTGVSRMVEACKAVGLPEPEYGADGLFVWITFKRPNAVANSDTNSDTSSDTSSDTNPATNLDTKKHLSDKQKEVLVFCVVPRSSREILEHIGVIYHHKNILKFINSLVDASLLERTIPDVPNSPQQRYVAKKK